MRINQIQVVEELAVECGVTRSQMEEIITKLKRYIYDKVRHGHRVNFSGFGWFGMIHRKGRIGVDPRKPSEKMVIKDSITPKFKAGEAFREAVRLVK